MLSGIEAVKVRCIYYLRPENFRTSSSAECEMEIIWEAAFSA